MDDKTSSRRSILGKIGTSVTGLATTGTAAAQSNYRHLTSEDWSCSNDCPEEKIASTKINLLDNGRDANTCLHWFSSVFIDSDSFIGWEHSLSTAGAAGSNDDTRLEGQKYRVEAKHGNIFPNANNERYGHYPAPNANGAVIALGGTLMSAAVAPLVAGAPWLSAASSTLKNNMAPSDGINIGAVPNGFKYRDTPGLNTFNNWCHFHQFLYRSELHMPKVNVKTAFSNRDFNITTLWQDAKFEIELLGEQGPQSTGVPSSLDPRDMTKEERENWEIKKVPKDTELAFPNHKERPKFVATSCPLTATVTTGSHTD
jgi:hypothetical protein